MTGHHNRSNDQACLPLKTVLRKLRDKYQWYYATYKINVMATHHWGTGHTGEDWNLNSHIDFTTEGDTRGIDIGPDYDNESTSSSDTMLAFGGFETDGHLSDLLSSSQANLTILTREINNLQQQAREGQPTEGLDCIERELQNLSVTLRARQTSTSVPT